MIVLSTDSLDEVTPHNSPNLWFILILFPSLSVDKTQSHKATDLPRCADNTGHNAFMELYKGQAQKDIPIIKHIVLWNVQVHWTHNVTEASTNQNPSKTEWRLQSVFWALCVLIIWVFHILFSYIIYPLSSKFWDGNVTKQLKGSFRGKFKHSEDFRAQHLCCSSKSTGEHNQLLKCLWS